MECVFTCSVRTECGMFVMCCMSCQLVVSGCTVSRSYVNVCNSDGLVLLICTLTNRSSVLSVLMVESMSVVVNDMLPLMGVMGAPHAFAQHIAVHGGKVMYFVSFAALGSSLGSLIVMISACVL